MNMNEEIDPNVAFLSHVGIAAHMSTGEDGKPVVVIETTEYQKRPNLVDRWYTRLYEKDGFSYFHERPRGTGTTVI